MKFNQRNIYYDTTGVLPNFYRAAQASSSTGYGINADKDTEGVLLTSLRTTALRTNMKRLWDRKIRHYSFMEAFIREETQDAALRSNARVLTMLDNLRRDLQNGSVDPPSYLFLGVLTYYTKGYAFHRAQFSRLFQLLMSNSKPDAVVFYSSLSYIPTVCRVQAPNLWDDNGVKRQPTFVGALNLRQTATLPAGVRELISFYVGAPHFYANQGQAFRITDGEGTPCSKQFSASRELFCRLTTTRMDEAQQQVFALNGLTQLFVFDTHQTIRKKMCWASGNYSFQGGYVMHFADLSSFSNMCSDRRHRGDYILVQYVKSYIAMGFTSC